MASRRKEDKRKEMGLASEKERKKEEKEILSIQEKAERRALRRKEIESNSLYQLVIKGAFFLDIADGLMGLFEFVGDSISSIFHLINLYLSIFVVKSFRLSFAVFSIVLVDLLIGFIPVLGSLIDFVFCSNVINRQLIRGWVEDDPSIRSRVNKVTIAGGTIGAGLIGLLYWLLS